MSETQWMNVNRPRETDKIDNNEWTCDNMLQTDPKIFDIETILFGF